MHDGRPLAAQEKNMIRITAKRKTGFYRCGAFHSAAPVEYADDYWTPEQLSVLKAEPMLRVEEVRDEAPPDIPAEVEIQEAPKKKGKRQAHPVGKEDGMGR
jgi:hypothetical protein